MLLSHAEETAEAEHSVGDVAAELVDHKTLDGAELIAVGAAHRRALDAVAGDQAVGFPGQRVGLHGCLHRSTIERAGNRPRSRDRAACAAPAPRSDLVPRPRGLGDLETPMISGRR